jgi:hypothetical protein
VTSRIRPLGSAIVLACALAGVAAGHATRADRLAAIRHARVWRATNVAAMDIRNGPHGTPAFRPGETVTCTFVPRPHGRGSTLKFDCALPSRHQLKVRYGRTNGEVYAQVAATRLLWALGFPANRMYPVRVVCRGCPPDPYHQRKTMGDASKTTVFDPATIDEHAEGKVVETKPDEGWSWHELDLVDEKAGGAPRAERDALRLLAALLQHSSNKAINQRILCLDPPSCARTVMMIVDLGKTFGEASVLNDDAKASVNFRAWSQVPVWKGSSGCVANLGWSLTGTLHDPTISEDGRRFLATLLDRLSDAQLHDLFTVARFPDRDPSASVDDWVRAFKAKRAEIDARRCDVR